jgi:cysteine desulfurase/selenocysteine lyase
MSTSEDKKGVAPEQYFAAAASPPDDLPELPPGLPDPAVLARLATEFFGDFPTKQKTATDLAANLGALPLAANVDPSSWLTEESLRLLPLEISENSELPKSSTNFVSSLSSAPAQDPVPPVTSVRAPFSFLETARPLFVGTLPASVDRAVAAVGLAGVPHQSPRSLIGAGDGVTFGEPSIPGAWRKSNIAEGSKAFQFIEENRAPGPISLQPVIEPLGSKAYGLADLGLSYGQFDVGAVRRDFPILQEHLNGRQLVWLDNAATTQKPQAVIDRLSYFYSHENSNIHRAAHALAARATDAYEAAREKTRRFLNAPSIQDIVFVRGATEGINLVAKSWGVQNVQKDDEIVITWLEHHANIVPWQMLCALKGAHLRVAPVDNRGDILLGEYTKLIGPRTRLVAIPQVSNALGTVTPVREMIEIAHRQGARVLLDGAQAVSHIPVDVQVLDCDFYVFSGHKVFAPTGIGVVFGKQEVLQQTPPWQGGGNMIADVTFEKTIYQAPPGRFEAGTGNIADAVGLGAALDYVQRIGMPNIGSYEHDLLTYGIESLRTISGLRLVGSPREQAGVISFVLDGFRTEDVGAALNREGIAVRAGHHCAQPILRRFGLESSVRASLALYNTCEEIDALVAALWNLKNGRAAIL